METCGLSSLLGRKHRCMRTYGGFAIIAIPAIPGPRTSLGEKKDINVRAQSVAGRTHTAPTPPHHSTHTYVPLRDMDGHTRRQTGMRKVRSYSRNPVGGRTDSVVCRTTQDHRPNPPTSPTTVSLMTIHPAWPLDPSPSLPTTNHSRTARLHPTHPPSPIPLRPQVPHVQSVY
jgi:hypothetical protein